MEKPASKSLQATSEGIGLAQQALQKSEYKSKIALAAELGLSRSTIHSFFRGKAVNRENFFNICKKLELPWQKIAGLVEEAKTGLKEKEQDNSSDINALVQKVREKVKSSIQERCGKMRVLDMEQPIGLGDIYTDVNILKKITGRRRLNLSDLLQAFDPEKENFDRCGLGEIQERVPGLDAVNCHRKLMVFGKPGAGKTTFLKYLAIQCICGQFQSNHVPLFITLKQFAEISEKPTLLEFINQDLAKESITDIQILELINQGRTLILLDGLDEVREEDSDRVLEQIKEFSAQYRTNRFLITCRIAARDDDNRLEQFVHVEVAYFNNEQIKIFIKKWFHQEESDVSERFIQQLKLNQPIKELATNPLLLTLLCLEFEDSGDFPSDHAELYNRAIHTLLRKWDSKRGIRRDEVYKKLSVRHKEDLLSDLAWTTFKRKDYFFKQRDIERYISDYIHNLPEAKSDPEALRLDSEAVLKSIEAQHGLLVERAKGIYSFSHLTFHEYFTAREIVFRTQPLEEGLQTLVGHIKEKRWREIFLLAAELLQPSADRLLLLMKRQIEALVAGNEELQTFLHWVYIKSNRVKVRYKLAAVRAFYFDHAIKLMIAVDMADVLELDLTIDFLLTRALASTSLSRDLDFARNLDFGLDLKIDEVLARDLNLILKHVNLDRYPSDRATAYKMTDVLDCDSAISRDRILDDALKLELEPELKQDLQELKAQLPDPDEDEEGKNEWWHNNGRVWAEKLIITMIGHRAIGYRWQFKDEQKKMLKDYYNINLLLVNCLNSDCYVSREVRQEIEDTLLLPIAEIEKKTK